MSAEHLYGLPLRPTKMGLGLKEIWRIEKKKNIKKNSRIGHSFFSLEGNYIGRKLLMHPTSGKSYRLTSRNRSNKTREHAAKSLENEAIVCHCHLKLKY